MRQPFTDPPEDPARYFPRSEHDRLRREPYAEGASSREHPASYPALPPGTWRIDDRFVGPYGRAIEELVQFHPRELTPSEFDWRDPRAQLRYQGKWDDAMRYARWLAKGLEPPPIEVVATDGQLRVAEGHRRLVAADMAGVPIKAWVSWSVPQPEGLRDAVTGAPIPVGMTYELVHGRRRVANGDGDTFVDGEPVVYGPLASGPYAYRLGHAAQSAPVCETAPPGGALRVRLEDGILVELDCDNFSPVRRVFEDPDDVDRIWEDASPALRKVLEAREPNPEEPPVMRGRMKPPEFDPKGWWMSEKLDGVRGWWTGKQLISRKGNVFAVPDWFVQGWPKNVVIDGEIFGGRGKFNETSGIVRRARPGPAWKQLVFFAFDLPNHKGTYEERMKALDKLVEKIDSPYLAAVPRMQLANKDQLQLALEKVEQAGGEGLVIVAPKSRYAAGQRTPDVLKVKRFHDAEGTVFDYEPGKGRHKGSVGALWVRDIEGREFKVGTGLSDKERKNARKLFPPGTVVTYRYFETTPSGKPRFPSFLRVRSEEPDTRVANIALLKESLIA